jgi:predicted pyridoxine 5'-phosphate oxidase superfamily flavin-nucleotide-binding protein
MAMNKFLAIERDEEGNHMPQVGQFQAFDPSVFTKIIDEHAQLMASYTGSRPRTSVRRRRRTRRALTRSASLRTG